MQQRALSRKESVFLNPPNLQGRWLTLSSFARMNVGSSGGHGPACRPYEHVLQILVGTLFKSQESWTVYRDRENKRGTGKIVFKKWNGKADWAKLQKLEGKPLPKDWHKDCAIATHEFPVSYLWLKKLDRALSAVCVPPVAGTFRSSLRGLNCKISFWHGEQESTFSWHQKPPSEWLPLANFIFDLRRIFERHAKGEALKDPPSV